MNEKEVRRLVYLLTGDDEIYDFLIQWHDFSFWVRCHPAHVETVAETLRAQEIDISNRLRVEIPHSQLSHPLSILPVYFMCLERERSLIIPRPNHISPERFKDVLTPYIGQWVTFIKEKP